MIGHYSDADLDQLLKTHRERVLLSVNALAWIETGDLKADAVRRLVEEADIAMHHLQSAPIYARLRLALIPFAKMLGKDEV